MSGDQSLIEKRTIHSGTQGASFKNGTKVKFHFQTRKNDEKKTLIDDSKTMGAGKPMELVLGKKFKLEVWEVIVQKLALREVAAFVVDKSLVSQYPFVSKTLRDLDKKEVGHMCAMTIQTEGLGFEDLNDLMKNPCDLEFTLELLEVSQPGEYEKETWQMSEGERIDMVPMLKEKGNNEFKLKNYQAAAEYYTKAIAILEQLMTIEKPRDVEWNIINEKKLPILLNYALCKLFEGDFYTVIEHCTTVLESEPDNVKALYRRAKAHVGAWNPDLARRDFNRVIELDTKLISTVKKELNLLDEMIKTKNTEDKNKLKRLFS
ncbi:PREDICTED: AH receptor-interacting protein [Nicrophorus vespilloides]|uniref:AH receptor-interacting protein n=1 Tax=Nicrophorus vespilloides TaxID=110193 RepID=A0ABM1MMN5_NICVS|nr:PREDICTED: AH receptor-interacting protein [Nicrophorus vespilloides]